MRATRRGDGRGCCPPTMRSRCAAPAGPPRCATAASAASAAVAASPTSPAAAASNACTCTTRPTWRRATACWVSGRTPLSPRAWQRRAISSARAGRATAMAPAYRCGARGRWARRQCACSTRSGSGMLPRPIALSQK
eukprot:scaffold35922_cov65-Phaeocystis_antarctica.AAC.1